MKSIVEKAREIVTQLYERNMVSWNDLDREVVFAIQALNAEVQRMEALAQPAPYVAVSNNRMSVDRHTGNVSIGTATQPEQEPVAWISHNAGLYHFKPDQSLDPLPLYLAPPPQRTWVGLTDEELLFLHGHDSELYDLIKVIEAKLRSKNT